jgi:hypothetical protein
MCLRKFYLNKGRQKLPARLPPGSFCFLFEFYLSFWFTCAIVDQFLQTLCLKTEPAGCKMDILKG